MLHFLLIVSVYQFYRLALILLIMPNESHHHVMPFTFVHPEVHEQDYRQHFQTNQMFA